jgi:hypothetical protein
MTCLLPASGMEILRKPVQEAPEATPSQATPSGPTMDVVQDGQARAVIVVPDNPSALMQYAAGELQWHIEKATGVRLEIKQEAQAAQAAGAIYLGACAATTAAGLKTDDLPANGFRIKATDKALYLAGHDGAWTGVGDDVSPMGTLFAVYDWLDRHLGVRWLWPGELGTYVPRRDSLDAGPAGERTSLPPFISTKLRTGAGPYFSQWQGMMSAEARGKFFHDTAVWLRRQMFARPTSLEYGHGFEHYWERFGAQHPEWFALRPDGKREPSDAAYHCVQMCVSNPGLHRQIIADWLEQRRKHPDLPWINGCENDYREAVDHSCNCEACRAWDPANPQVIKDSNPYALETDKRTTMEGLSTISLSDRYARFWLALQKEGEKHDPNATVAGYAYGRCAEPPLETKLNDRIVVWIVPPYAFPLSPDQRERFQKIWDGWAATGARLILRPNYTLEGYCAPYIYASQFGSEFKYAAAHGLAGTDFDSMTGMWGTQGPNLYVLGRLHARPDLEVDAVLDEYYSGFGPAAEAVRKYFAHWEKVTDGRQSTPLMLEEVGGVVQMVDWSRFHETAGKTFTPETFARGSELLERASAAASGDPVAAQRVEFLRKGLEHARLSLETYAIFNESQQSPDDPAKKEAFEQALVRLDAYRRSIETDHVADFGFLGSCERRSGYDRAQVQMLGRYETLKPLPLSWSFQWDPQDTGVKEGWFADDFPTRGWLTARTDKSWEAQPVGQDWREAHGSDYDGIAWYRAMFKVPEKAHGRKILLYIGAVDESCTVWVNGQKLLERRFDAATNPDSWQEAFTVDVTDVARLDAPNTVAVRVEDRSGAGGIWKTCALVTE